MGNYTPKIGGNKMWKLGANISMFGCYGEDRYRKMKEYGIDCVDIHLEAELEGRTEEEFEAYILGIKAKMDEAGVTPTQAHGPFKWPIHDETEQLRAARMVLMKRSIRCAALMGIKNWVIHPIVPFGTGDFWPEEVWRINEEFSGSCCRRQSNTASRSALRICRGRPSRSVFPSRHSSSFT